jgi:fimbrial chaperone protein
MTTVRPAGRALLRFGFVRRRSVAAPAPRRTTRALAIALAVAVYALAVACAFGGSFQVNPIRVDLGPGQSSQALVVRNDGAQPLVVQMSVQAWSQVDGRDAYAPTQDALVTPPIAQIAPGAEQVIRVGLRRAPDPSRQGTFRLFVQEVPGTPTAGFSGLQVALRVAIPVFVAGAGAVARDVAWSVQRDEEGLALTLENRGNVHVQLLDVALALPGHGSPLARQSQVAYVLAGQRRTFAVPLGAPLPSDVAALHLTALSDAGPADVVLPLPR